MRQNQKQAQAAFLSAQRAAFGPLADDVFSTKRFFATASINEAVTKETAGARLNDHARRNVELRHMSALVKNITERSRFGSLSFNCSDDEASEYCEKMAHKIESTLIHHFSGEVPPVWLLERCERIRVNPVTFASYFEGVNVVDCVDCILVGHQLDKIDDKQSPEMILSDLLRITDENWWFRQWRKHYVRLVDEVARAIGHVKKNRAPYLSNKAFQLWNKRQFQNYEFMKSTEVENDDGQIFDLSDIAMKGMANRAIRRAELMIRLRGFEILADVIGYKAEFWTITCPSRFHPTTSKKTKRGKTYAVENSKWVLANRPTVREAQQYLSSVWSRIRAALSREDIKCFGFRIAEPHADGCPHWHLVVFVPADHVSVFRSAVDGGKADRKNRDVVLGTVAELGNKYALSDSPDEQGADRHRFTVEPIKEGINPDTGQPYSATGYVAKYISKNIDGYGVEGLEDYDGGGDLKNNARRVVAWASVHGVRQFQQFGGAPVGIWRELRRLHQLRDRESSNEEKTQRGSEGKNSVLRSEGKGDFTPAFLDVLFDQTEQEDAAQAWASFCLIFAANPKRFEIIYQERVREKYTAVVDELLDDILKSDLPTNATYGDWHDHPERLSVAERVAVFGRYGNPIVSPSGLAINKQPYCTRPFNWTMRRKAVAPPDLCAPPNWVIELERHIVPMPFVPSDEEAEFRRLTESLKANRPTAGMPLDLCQ